MLLDVLFPLFSVCDGVSVSTQFYWSVFMFCLNKKKYFAGWLFAANLRLSFYVCHDCSVLVKSDKIV